MVLWFFRGEHHALVLPGLIVDRPGAPRHQACERRGCVLTMALCRLEDLSRLENPSPMFLVLWESMSCLAKWKHAKHQTQTD